MIRRFHFAERTLSFITIAALLISAVPVLTPNIAEAATANGLIKLMPNPDNGVGDGNGEWFSISNTGTISLDITGWQVEDAQAFSYTFGSVVIAPSAEYVVCANDDTALNGGVDCDDEWSGGGSWNNGAGGDTFTLLNASSTQVASFSYTNPIDEQIFEHAFTQEVDDSSSAEVSECTITTSVVTTDLATWDLTETRSTGHNEITNDGLRIWTEGTASTDKAAGYYLTNFPLSGLGDQTIDQSLDYDADFGIEPGLQLVVDFDNNGSIDGILVGEAVYGNDWWLTNSSAQFVKDGAPDTSGGHGSGYHGTPDEWLSVFPNAQVKSIGYSLGSGVHGDGVIKSINLGCTEYTFSKIVGSNTIIVSGDTAAGENQPGWLFNRDTSTDTPFLFDNEESQIGDGALHVLPIGANPADKFVGEFYPNSLMGDIESFSYDFNIGSTTAADANEFYLNVYANFASSSPTKFYDCRYNVVPATGILGGWTTVTFDPEDSYPVTQHGTSPATCPASPEDMGDGAVLRAFVINLGDTSAGDQGVAGYFDNVVFETEDMVTTYDFEPTPTSTVTICKLDEEGDGLEGWTLMLKGEEVEDLVVPANSMVGVNTSALDSTVSYIASVSGTWLNDRDPDNYVDAEYSSDDNWLTQMDGYTGYGNNVLDLQVDGQFIDWGPHNIDHAYSASFTPAADGAVNVRVFDGNDPTPEPAWYNDNSGSLNVTISEGYAGVTDEEGCVTFEDVPYDTYEVDEVMQDGWSNVSGLGELVVDSESESATVVNTDEPLTVSDVQICKFDESNQPLSGWTMMLLGDAVEEVEVPSNGMEVFSSNLLDGNYAFVANGTYVYRPSAVGSTTDAGFSMRTAGDDPIDPTGHPYNPWVLVNDFPSPYAGYLGITVDNAVGTTDWGSIFNPNHEYAMQYTGDGDAASFQILDDSYGDNSGSLTVAIREGYVGVTDGTGCITFENVPYDTYEVDEIMQPGWSNVSGLGEVEVDSETKTFNVVNTDEPVVPDMCSVTVVSDQSNFVEETEDDAVLSWAHPAWTAIIDAASWIWGTEYVADPTTDTTQTFVKTFDWSGNVASATLAIASDNSYVVTLNGVEVASSTDENNFQEGTKDTYDLAAFIDHGENELEIEVFNKGVPGASATDNPAGLKYNLTVVSDEAGDSCMEAPDEPGLEITNPAVDGQVLGDSHTFEAKYIDADANPDSVQWAIRADSCLSGVNTVAGNVDGFDTPYMWNGSSFSSTIDMSSWDEGEYCFVVNPTEDGGTNFRETRLFTLEHPEPAQCTIVSDTNTLVVDSNEFAVATWDDHHNWTHDIIGATWIWDTEDVVDPEVETTRTFQKTFTVTSLEDANFEIAADNAYSVYINGVLRYEDLNPNNYQTHDEYGDIEDYLVTGENELVIVVTNFAMEDSAPVTNPAGALFKLSMEVGTEGSCEDTTAPDTTPTTYEVFGFAWDDENENDVKDGEEEYLSGVAVSITNGASTTATTTDAGGRYFFMVAAGDWDISSSHGGWDPTYPDTSSNIHEITVTTAASGPHDFGYTEDNGGGGGGGGGGGNDDDDDDTPPPGIVAGTSTPFGVGGGFDPWEQLIDEIGGSNGVGSVLGAAVAQAQEEATSTPEVDEEDTIPVEEDQGTSEAAPWTDWLCDYLWLLPLLWIIASAAAYWRKESYNDPAYMFWTQLVFGVIGFILIVTHMIWAVPCAWLPSAIVAVGSAIMSYFGRDEE